MGRLGFRNLLQAAKANICELGLHQDRKAMKFGKRLLAEAARSENLAPFFFDYRAAKRDIDRDVTASDAKGTSFGRTLVAELQRVSQFYRTRVSQLESRLQSVAASGHPQPEVLGELRSQVQEMTRFAALNYLAVVKSIKKRNRHLRENFGGSADTSLHALDLLVGEVFFTSPRLANLSTQLEVLDKDLLTRKPRQAAQMLEEYTCPVCLDVLHNPVVLTCAHRFCWGCVVAHCQTCRDQGAAQQQPQQQQQASSSSADAGKEEKSAPMALLSALLQEEELTPSFFPCPVCRKPQLSDVDSLQVDPTLESFISSLQAMSMTAATASASTATSASSVASATAMTVVVEQEEEVGCSSEVAGAAGSIAVRERVAMQLSASTSQPQLAAVIAAERLPTRTPSPQLPAAPWGVIPPQVPPHQGKLCVLLDLDGTLVSSFTPKRAPRLPSYMRTHVVGVGSKLNPQGVFVVERPGLGQFLQDLARVAEVVVFTAGLEEYAAPIIDAIDPQGCITTRIYREGTLRTDYYQCVKDMARLNRDLARCVLVDDTPLAFLHQPDNGIPVLGFRGDPDDQLLLEAVLPLLQSLAVEADVRPMLRKRFEMMAWFKKHGLPAEQLTAQALENAAAEREAHRAEAATPSTSPSPFSRMSSQSSLPLELPKHVEVVPRKPPTRGYLLLTDFDKTLLDADAGERVMEQLAPELLPMLVGIESGAPWKSANFIPITNTLLAELQRRGVSRDQLLMTLQHLGSNPDFMPRAVLRMLHGCSRTGIDVKILSDCNSVFITHILAGAKASSYVQDVITNQAAFEYIPPSSTSHSMLRAEGGSAAAGAPATPAASQARHRLVIKPFHDTGKPHRCPLCPDNMCKGSEVRALRAAGTYKSIVFAGDGANDICAALALGPADYVLARKGYPLAEFMEQAAAGAPGTRMPRAAVHLWGSHDEFATKVQQLTSRRL